MILRKTANNLVSIYILLNCLYYQKPNNNFKMYHIHSCVEKNNQNNFLLDIEHILKL